MSIPDGLRTRNFTARADLRPCAQTNLPSAIGTRGMPVAAGSLRKARAKFEREDMAAALTGHNYQVGFAAEELGLERAKLYRKIRQLGVPRCRTG